METILAKEVLSKMIKIRMTEETIADRYSEGKMRCPTHLCTGQEAVGAVVCSLLRKDDFVVSSHRAHGHYLAKGGSLKRMMAEIYGKSSGCCGGKGGSMHLIDREAGFQGSTAIVGGTIPVGVGLGLSIKLKGTDQISCVFFGDAAVEEGVFYESVNFAVLKRLPVLFICENNLYSVYSPMKVRQPVGRKIYEFVASIGCESLRGAGNDPLDIFNKADSAINKIRSGEGPCFMEYETYRWREHCGPNYDDNLGYREEQEVKEWVQKDPVAKYKKYVIDKSILSEDEICSMELSIKSEIDEAFIFAETSSFPEKENIYTDLYK